MSNIIGIMTKPANSGNGNRLTAAGNLLLGNPEIRKMGK